MKIELELIGGTDIFDAAKIFKDLFKSAHVSEIHTSFNGIKFNILKCDFSEQGFLDYYELARIYNQE